MGTIDYDVMKSRKLLILINHAAGKKCWKMSLGHEDEWYFLKGDRKYVPELRICLFNLIFFCLGLLRLTLIQLKESINIAVGNTRLQTDYSCDEGVGCTVGYNSAELFG